MGHFDQQPGKSNLTSPPGATAKAEQPAVGKQTRTGAIEANDAKSELADATAMLQRAIVTLYKARNSGVQIAKAEAQAYSRARPSHDESLLFELAMIGLEMVTAGIAGSIVKRLEGPLRSTLSHISQEHSLPDTGAASANLVRTGVNRIAASAQSPSNELIAGISDGLKQGIKSASKSATKALQPEGKADTNKGDGSTTHRSPLSADPLLSFFAHEENVLQTQELLNSEQIATQARNILAPMLKDQLTETKSVVAMGHIVDAVKAAVEEATVNQAQSSAMLWVRYVSQASNGTDVDDKSSMSVTDTRALAAPPTAEGAPAARRGLVDIEFAASAGRPEEPAKLRKLALNGVSNVMATRLARQPLIETGLAVRAHGIPSDGDAYLPVTVVRDEAGNISYNDASGTPGSPARWLARKAGIIGGGEQAQLIGAKKLVEAELMSQTVPLEMIKTDSTDNPFGGNGLK